MAPVPPNTTLRVRVRYSGPRGDHSMLFHGVLGQALGNVVGAVSLVVQELSQCQYDGTVWHTAEWSSPGQVFFVPVLSWTPITAPNTFVPSISDPSGTYGNFVARSIATGVRKRLFCFNWAFNLVRDMRYEAGEQTAIDDVVSVLNSTNGTLGVIDGTPAVWKQYANAGVNDYWTRQDRKL